MAGALKRGLLGSISWFFLAGALVLLWFVVLSGVTTHTPLNKIYFLKADTTGIQGAHRPVSQWTFWKICGEYNANCDQPKAALPFGYAWYDSSVGAPPKLIGSHGHHTTSSYYFYMWRFGWVFYLIGFIFANFAIITALASCVRVISGLTGILTLISTFWMTLAACFMTAIFVKARNRFHDDGRYAHVGPYAFGFTWASLVLLFISSVLFLGGCFIGRQKRETAGVYTKEGAYNQGYPAGDVQSGYTGNGNPPAAQPANANAPATTTTGQATQATRPVVVHEDVPTMRGEGRRGFFPRKKETQV